MYETFHKKTKSLEFVTRGSRNNDKKDSYINSLNKTSMKNSLLSTSRRNFSRFDYQDIKKKYIFEDVSLNYDDLKHNSDIVMADYKYDSIKSKDPDNFEKLIEKDFNSIISNNKSFIRSNHLPLLESINDESQLKVAINVLDFNNPIKAFGTIKKNKIIFDSMVKNYYEIQKKRYSDLIKDLEHVEKFNKTGYHRIKITTMGPKNDQINNANNNNNNESKEKKDQRKEILY